MTSRWIIKMQIRTAFSLIDAIVSWKYRRVLSKTKRKEITMAIGVGRILRSTRNWSDRRPLNGVDNAVATARGKTIILFSLTKLDFLVARGVNLFGLIKPTELVFGWIPTGPSTVHRVGSIHILFDEYGYQIFEI